MTEQKQYDESAVRDRAAQRASSAEIYNRWGAALLKRGQVADAILAFEQSLRLRPRSALAHNLLSVALRLQGRLEKAIFHCREAVRLSPDLAEAHNNLGSMLEESGLIDESIASLQEALRLKPDFANAHSNLGIALYRQHRYTEAVVQYRRAIAMQPDLAEAHNNLGSVLFDLGRGDEALESFAEAVRLKPDYREPHWGRALVWLSRGEFERGWSEFEWRLSPLEARQCPQPRWNGSSVAGRTILLDAEQGLGDTLQFVRYGSLLRQQGGKVVLVCQPRLVPLLAGGCPSIDQVVARGERVPPFDVHLPLLSLPRVFGTTLANIPAAIPYLRADPSLVERWSGELSQLPGFKIGIAWQGSPAHPGDRERSIPLSEFEPLGQVSGVRLISLQKGPGTEQLPLEGRRLGVVDFSERLDEADGPFMDTAAIMRSLDLVITCDSALCHLAGAMGIPTWVAISAVPDWRWLTGRDDSPWYPSLRLFRQNELDRWSDVFERISAEVAMQVGRH